MAPACEFDCPAQSHLTRSYPIAGALFVLGATTVFPQPPVASIAELQQQIEGTLRQTNTPAAGIALVGRTGPIWVAGVGLADRAQNRSSTEDTLFAIGSISKSFVALSVLKLQEEGRLNLRDTLRSRAPEVAFVNRWETTDPVRLVHLLEHTAGWDDNTPSEAAWNSTPELPRLETLRRRPLSLTSRWRPGTRFSYSNLGPDVAACVVEKVTGEPFEDYVSRTWFTPLGMTGASYFKSPEIQSKLAMGYHSDGEAVTYSQFNVLLRPAGGLVASPRDMANFIEFFLNRGNFRGNKLLPASAIDRMERPTSTYAAAENVEFGYGLGNAATAWRNWVFHGHGGSVPGGLADLLYLPEERVGYALMINSDNQAAMDRLEDLIRAYLLRNAKPPQAPAEGGVDEAQMNAYAGWYEPVTPRNENSAYLESFLGMTRMTAANGRLYLQDLTNGTYAYVRVQGRHYRRPDNTRSLVLVGDRTDGTLFETVGGPTFRRMPSYVADLKLGFISATGFLMVSSVAFSLVWLPRMLFGDLKGVPQIGARTDPLLASLSGFAVVALIWVVSGDYYARAGGPLWAGPLATLALNGAHALFAYFALRGLSRALRRHRSIGRPFWWHCLATSLTLSVWAVYLAYGGLRSEFA